MNVRQFHVKNQFIIISEEGEFFQSYDTIIIKKKDGKITLDINAWNYSNTSGKYRNLFLGETKAETEKKIKAGVYKLEDLN